MTDDQFHAERLTGLGGSDAPIVVLGEHYGRTAYDLWLEKTGQRPAPDLDSPDIRRGKRQEPVAAMVFEEVTGLKVQPAPAMIRHPTRPYMIAHMDRIILPDEDVLEIKCPRMMTYRKYQLEGIPAGIQLQGQHMLAIKTEAKRVVFGIYTAEIDEIMVVPIDRDEALIEMIQEAEGRFWERVEAREWPEPLPVVQSLALPKIGGELYRIEDSAWAKAAEAYYVSKAIQTEAEALVAASKDRLIDLMGEHDVVEGHGLRVYHRESAGRSSFDKEALAADHPEIDLSKYMKRGKPYRTFKSYFLESFQGQTIASETPTRAIEF